jgi:hypothetical protein
MTNLTVIFDMVDHLWGEGGPKTFDPDLFLLSGINIHTKFRPSERATFNLWTAEN